MILACADMQVSYFYILPYLIQTECVSTPAASPVAKLHSTSAALLTVSDQSWRITSARRATLLLVTNNRAVKELSRKFHNIPRRPLKGQPYCLLQVINFVDKSHDFRWTHHSKKKRANILSNNFCKYENASRRLSKYCEVKTSRNFVRSFIQHAAPRAAVLPAGDLHQ